VILLAATGSTPGNTVVARTAGAAGIIFTTMLQKRGGKRMEYSPDHQSVKSIRKKERQDE
jgi:ammonia channel protein AmtB